MDRGVDLVGSDAEIGRRCRPVHALHHHTGFPRRCGDEDGEGGVMDDSWVPTDGVEDEAHPTDAARSKPTGIWQWHIGTDEITWSPGAETALGFESGELGRCPRS